MNHSKQLSVVRSALVDSLSWCGRLSLAEPSPGHVGASLRSPELRAAALRAAPPADGATDAPAFSTAADRFTDFLRARRELVRARGLAGPSLEQVEAEMRRPMALLLSPFCPVAPSEPSPEGFLDARGMPPWDSWIALLPATSPQGGPAHHLLSWVPRWAAALVDGAIQASADGGHGWAHVEEAGVRARGFGQPWEESPLPICP